MARPATGWIVWRKDADGVFRWHTRITLPGGRRRIFYPLDPDIPEWDRSRAQSVATITSKWYREHAAKTDSGVTLVAPKRKYKRRSKTKAMATIRRLVLAFSDNEIVEMLAEIAADHMTGEVSENAESTNARVSVPHPDDATDVREAFDEARHDDLLSTEESAEYLRALDIEVMHEDAF
jgi:hypothetical protein